MKIARVFATKTNMCPKDSDAYFEEPDLFTPRYDEVHISITFTWAMARAFRLKEAWESVCPNVKVGGPAWGSPAGEFAAGMYLRRGVTITTRGCPGNCWFCFVPKREGRLRELPIMAGNIVQDNNLLAASEPHIDKVFQMLSSQKRIDFSGGLEAARITDRVVERLRSLSIHHIWLSYDQPEAEGLLRLAVNKLKRYFSRDQIRCYVLIGYPNDSLALAESRLRKAWEIGTLPFAMRYRTPSSDWEKTFVFRERAWNLFTRQWIWPRVITSIMKGGD